MRGGVIHETHASERRVAQEADCGRRHLRHIQVGSAQEGSGGLRQEAAGYTGLRLRQRPRMFQFNCPRGCG